MGYLTKKLASLKLGKGLGLRFSGDNKVVAVLSHGEYNRIEQGFFRIKVFSETTKEPIAYTMRTGIYHVPLITKDNFKVHWHIKVQFIFDLRKASNPSIACNFNETILQSIVGTRVQQVLSLHVPKYNLAELNTEKARENLTAIIEKFVAKKVEPVGITLPPDGVMLLEIDLPESYHDIVEHEHRLEHLRSVLAADGELCLQDKLILAFATLGFHQGQGGQGSEASAANMMPMFMMMQNMFSQMANGTPPPPPSAASNGHATPQPTE